MKTITLMLIFGALALSVHAQTGNNPGIPGEISQQQEINNHKKTSGFISNNGQLSTSEGKPDDNVFFYSVDADMRIYLTGQGLSFVFQQPVKNGDPGINPGDKSLAPVALHRIDLQLLGSKIRKENIYSSDTVKSENINYYIGAAAVLGLEKCRRVVVASVYDGIDFAIYFDKNDRFKYEFIVHPHASADQIKMKYDGDEPLNISNEANLIKIKTSYTEISDGKLYCYQNNSTSAKTIRSSYTIRNNEIKINLGHYNHSETLVIDPLLQMIWGTYIGGAQLDSYNACASDNNGNFFAVGISQSNTFPVVTPGGAYSQSYVAQDDVVISKFSSGGVLLWSTFFGGSLDDWGNDIAVDASGNVFVTGQVLSANFPFVNAGGGAYFDNTIGGAWGDAFLAKFTNNGALIHSTAVGGNFEEQGNAIKTDATGNIYIVGRTFSNANFPLLNPGGGAYYQSTIGSSNDYDAYIVKFAPALNQLWGTYYGWNGLDQLKDVEVDASNNVYVLGYTESTNMTVLNPGGGAYYQGANAGIADGMLSEFTSGGVLLWGTYFGGAGSDIGYHLEIDLAGNLYATGGTWSSSGFPLVNLSGAYYDGTYNGGASNAGDCFLSKFAVSTRQLVWSTYLGESLGDYAYSVITDASKRVYVAGWVEPGTGFPTVNPGGGAYYDGTHGNAGYNGYPDVFLCQFSATGAMTWSTYYGGNGGEYTPDLAVYGCNLFVSLGSTSNGNDVVDQGGGAFFQSSNGGYWDAQTLLFTIYDPSVYCNAGPDIYLCRGQCGVIGTNFGLVKGVSFSWAPATGLSCTTCQTPTACPTATTTYTLTTTIVASGCSTTDQVTVFVSPPPVANAGPDLNLFTPSCGGTSCGTIGSTSYCGCSYSWAPSTYLSSTTILQPTVCNYTTNNASITYTLTVTNTLSGCQNSDQVTVNFCNLRMADTSDRSTDIKIYPNPSNGHFTLEHALSDPVISIEVVDITGKLIRSFTPDNNLSTSEIDLSFVESGSYFIRVKTITTEKTERVIIE